MTLPAEDPVVEQHLSAEQSDKEVRVRLRQYSRRSFLVGGATAVAAAALWRGLLKAPQSSGIAAPFRRALEWNSRISRSLFLPKTLAPEFPTSRAVKQARVNGDIGLSDIDPQDWRLQVIGLANPHNYSQFSDDVMAWNYGWESDDDTPEVRAAPKAHELDAKDSRVKMKPMSMPSDMPKGIPGLLLTMSDIVTLPRTEMVTELKCIEGWSQVLHWGGVRLRDFIMAFPPVASSGEVFSSAMSTSQLPEYMGLETPDREYFVGIEREVATHPQTLLAYELNGEPLTPEHGAPLRLVTPLKYGIKQLKQLGRITYQNERPRDYWYQEGYDYYLGH